jgi:Tfp pilus assembly protein PilP
MKLKKYIIFIVITILSTSCFSEYQSRRTSVSAKNNENKAKQVYAEIQKKIKLDRDSFIYTKDDLPDPFQSIFDSKTAESTPIITSDIRTVGNVTKISELQRFDIDELRLVGLVYGTTSNDRRGLLKDPTGKTHNVRERELVGKNFGRISSIKKDRIIVNEETYEITGKRIVKKIPIKLETEE